jgi:hypothetical protein
MIGGNMGDERSGIIVVNGANEMRSMDETKIISPEQYK